MASRQYVVVFTKTCSMCNGSGRRSTARSASGKELERHERSGTPCSVCDGAKMVVDGWFDGYGRATSPSKAAIFQSKAAAGKAAERFPNAYVTDAR